ncbi:hypothetical protein [Paracraurococcus ruber]|uniref:Uncharacterized protein n=1 Tax=Paracraurococcus ruber TaxID=77675 RepID=A0ABS1D3I7_9PROT|nr:hypothetical protein [Paracraurococcus ruber]MBK1661175.1 hypothetical protein [Paracraurococcus ruber]TDG29323.1 hypothetical protein E2C05_18165 [Paracraurococcus ruber]
MAETWRHQVRVYLPEPLAELARAAPDAPALRPLMDLLARHDARPVSQLDAFEAYCAEAERRGDQADPLYRWTQATLADPAKRRVHLCAFALRVAGQEVYPQAAADELEAALRPLVGGGVVERLSRHDTNPATNMPVPAEYRG